MFERLLAAQKPHNERRPNTNASLQKAAPRISALDFIWFRRDQKQSVTCNNATQPPQDTRPPHHSSRPSHTPPPPPPPKGRGSVCTPWQETLTCTLRYFLPAAVHIFHQWGEGLHTGVIPQDIASSWAKYQWWSEMSSALPLQKIFSVFHPPPHQLFQRPHCVSLCQLYSSDVCFSSRINRPGQKEAVVKRKAMHSCIVQGCNFQNLIEPCTD